MANDGIVNIFEYGWGFVDSLSRQQVVFRLAMRGTPVAK